MTPPINPEIPASELAALYADKINGKVVLVTGASPNGLGAEFCVTIAQFEPKLIIIAGRNVEKLHITADAIASKSPNVLVKALELDLDSVSKAKESGERVLADDDVPCIDLLINNAGIMATEFAKTVEGFERQLAVNYLGPWVFTNTILPKVLISMEPRLVFVGSSGHRWGPVRWHDHDFEDGKSYDRWRAYGQAKTAVQLYALYLGKKLQQKAQVFSLDPGVIMTSLGVHIDWSAEFGNIRRIDLELGNDEAVNGWPKYRSKEAGATTHVYASFDPGLKDYTGQYLVDCHPAKPAVDTIRPWATSESEAERLWSWTEKLVNIKFPI